MTLTNYDRVNQGDLNVPSGRLHAEEAAAAQVQAAFELVDLVDRGPADVECD